MSAHRYWRVYITGAQNNPYVSAAEIQMFTATGGPNVCSGGTAFASSYYAPEARTPPTAFDGNTNTSTSWTNSGATNPSVANPEWIGYDFGAGNDKDIIGFNWFLRNDGFWGQAPSNFKLQYSDDNVSWTDRFAPATQTWTTQNESRQFFDPAFATVVVSKVVVQILRTNGTETPPDTTPGTVTADALDWQYLGATNYLILGSPSDYTLDWEYLGEPVTITNLANAIGGLAAVETGADTASIQGTVLVQGALDASESGSDVASFQGAPGVHGDLAASESGLDAFAAVPAGRVRVTGTAALVEQAVRDVLAAAGSALPTGSSLLGVVAWPASLPQYPASYGEQLQPVIGHTDPDTGPTQTRRRFTRGLTKGTMEFLLTIPQQVALDDFWTQVMQSGAHPVNLYHPWSGSVMQMRIPEAPSYASDSNLSVRATFGVEYFS
jgi:hypothetical protein